MVAAAFEASIPTHSRQSAVCAVSAVAEAVPAAIDGKSSKEVLKIAIQILLDFVGTMPMEKKVLVGPCGFAGECSCGKCVEMTSQERLNLIMKGMKDMCTVMDVFIVGGGISTSFNDIVPAVAAAAIGKLVTEKPLTKPAKAVEDKIILVGQTGNDRNNTLFRAGLAEKMRLAEALAVTLRTCLGKNTQSELFWGSRSPIWNNDSDTIFIRDSEG